MIIVRYDILTRVFITLLILTHNDQRLEKFSLQAIYRKLLRWPLNLEIKGSFVNAGLNQGIVSFTISKSHKRTALLIVVHVRWNDLRDGERSRLRNEFQKGICNVVATQCTLWRKWKMDGLRSEPFIVFVFSSDEW